ncbi:MAG: DUF6456 domain-containing protein [Rhizobiaceae bacterium]|nr:DUF6456 domain-containing protein [Rhizobiaceae bacterium]
MTQPEIMGEHAILDALKAGPLRMKPQAGGRIRLVRGRGDVVGTARAEVLSSLAARGAICRDGVMLASPTLPTPQRDTTDVAVTVDGVTTMARRVKIECPLDYLRSHKGADGQAWISASQWAAGDRLRTDFTRAHMMPGIGMRWSAAPKASPSAASGGADMTDGAIAARARVDAALDAVGPELSGLLLDVCCFLKGLTQVEAERALPPRSAKVLVRIGLGMLERHYAPPRRARPRHWGADDYRPLL